MNKYKRKYWGCNIQKMFAILLIFAIFGYVSSSTRNDVPTPVSSLSVNSYLGHWQQVYAAPTNAIFQGYGACITADYGLLENGNIDVLNTQLDKNGEIDQIGGYGYYKNASEPGKLTVHLDGVPTDAPYWVVKLGEVKDDQYQYSIITTPSFISLWVLVRDATTFSNLYDAEITEYLNQYEFKYVTVSQENCEQF